MAHEIATTAGSPNLRAVRSLHTPTCDRSLQPPSRFETLPVALARIPAFLLVDAMRGALNGRPRRHGLKSKNRDEGKVVSRMDVTLISTACLESCTRCNRTSRKSAHFAIPNVVRHRAQARVCSVHIPLSQRFFILVDTKARKLTIRASVYKKKYQHFLPGSALSPLLSFCVTDVLQRLLKTRSKHQTQPLPSKNLTNKM